MASLGSIPMLFGATNRLQLIVLQLNHHITYLRPRPCLKSLIETIQKCLKCYQVVTEASSRLITERLNHFRHDFSRKKKTLDHTIRQLEGLLDPTYMTKTHHLNGQKSSLTNRQHIKTHRKKFADLLEESNSPFLSPYDSMTAPHFTSPSFHGPLSTTTPKQKTETTLKTVVNLSDAQLSRIPHRT